MKHAGGRGALVVTIALTLSPVRVLASDGSSGFSVDPVRDGLTTVGLVSLAMALRSEVRTFEGESPCGERQRVSSQLDSVCDRALLNGVDRWVTEVFWSPARELSDAGLFTLALTPFAVSAASTALDGRAVEHFGEDSLVSAQTLAVVALTTQILKNAVRRPRPLSYSERFDVVERHAAGARLSFPSGHTSLAFSGASVTAVLFARRYPGEWGGVVASVGAYLVAATVGLFRILGAKHFVSDVLAGAALGTALGLIVPLLHREGRSPAALEASLRTPVAFGVGF